MTKVLAANSERKLRVFVVWEPVIPTDWSPPSTLVLGRIPDPRVRQYWDSKRTLSRLMGENPANRKTIVWDLVALYPPGAQWTDKPPQPVFSGNPVVDVAAQLEQALAGTAEAH